MYFEFICIMHVCSCLYTQMNALDSRLRFTCIPENILNYQKSSMHVCVIRANIITDFFEVLYQFAGIILNAI